MTLEEKIDLVRFVISDKAPGKKLEIEELNTILKAVEYDLMDDVYGRASSIQGFETDGVLTDAILPFKKTASISLSGGGASLPTDYLHWGRCSYTNGNSESVPVELVTTQESEQRRFNAITYPTARYPIVELTGSTLQVYPTTITPISLTYIKKPTPASYAVKTENGVGVYDSSSSVQTEWPIQKHVDYVRHILKYLGIAVDNQFLVSYTEQKQAMQ